jgi:hypothetical protein
MLNSLAFCDSPQIQHKLKLSKMRSCRSKTGSPEIPTKLYLLFHDQALFTHKLQRSEIMPQPQEWETNGSDEDSGPKEHKLDRAIILFR